MDIRVETENFVASSRHALQNRQLQLALSTSTGKFTISRNASVSCLGGEWERLRTRAKEIKEHAINNLDYYLEEFSSKVEQQGGHIFWANDAAEANQYICDLARHHGIRLVVKSKSMMTEEIELNRALAEAGVEAVETDLGEYIIQLAGERPSHIIAPAIHKTRGEVSDLLAEKLHVARPATIEQITVLARNVLRERFAAAGMGITGGNFAVAETGTLVLVENEGNIRLTTSLPRIHVALIGIEKVIPRMDDLDVFLRLLPRSASGQQMSSYVSFLTGVKQSVSEEGPEELHVVILDNGRTDILANPRLRESLYCIRCGACLNTCPVYQKIGGHAYGWIYPGPIGALLTPQLIGRERAADLPFASSLCGACRDVCPVKINIPDMLLHLRSEIKEPQGESSRHSSNVIEKVARPGARLRKYLATVAERTAFRLWAAVMKNVTHYQRAAQMARLAQRIFGKKLWGLTVPRWTATRNLPPLASRSFREQWPEIAQTVKMESANKDEQ
jgi:L-lactate dehydrogenase complex protein LldF